MRTKMTSWYRIKGIKNIIFYGLPHYAHFYPEILNFLDSGHQSTAVTATALYTRYDNHRLADIVGSRRCTHMMSAKKHVHMFVAGEQSEGL
ncbi:Digestive organ expansion factor [Exaiptasia diaphana]|nr:Digestive organ expansion factor [Exaiptasia diaphana]